MRDVIWAVDDSPLQGQLVARELGSDHDVVTFQGGAAVLERLGNEAPPSVLLLDWHMPDVGGLDVCRFVRARYDAARLPILVVSASATRESVLEAFDAGANDFIRKPFDSDELRARLAGILHSRHLHEDLAKAREALKLEGELRERFIGILGHDLRQPLNTFFVGTHALGLQPMNDHQAQVVRRLERATRRMHRMIADVLDLTKVRVGAGLDVTRTSEDLQDMARVAVDDTRANHPDRTIELRLSGSGDGEWDRDRLLQIFTNLIGNALEHGDRQAPIVVEVAEVASDVTLSVQNEGPAIGNERLSTLFDAFRRGQSEGTTGLGLGLFIVRAIAEAHGGEASATSVGNVTRFTVHLPRRRSDNPVGTGRTS